MSACSVALSLVLRWEACCMTPFEKNCTTGKGNILEIRPADLPIHTQRVKLLQSSKETWIRIFLTLWASLFQRDEQRPNAQWTRLIEMTYLKIWNRDFLKKRNRDCCFLVLHVSSLEVATLSKQVKTWTNEKMNNASRRHRASRCSQDERNRPVQRVGTYLNWDARMETPRKPALGQRCLNCNWWMARGSVWTTPES